jgi:hypothetical protein
MLYELRTLVRGSGPRAGAAILDGGFGGVFSTEVGTMGETVVIRPYDPDATSRAARGEGRGRLEASVAPQTMELLQPAPFMKPLEAQELGKVYELAWFDFAPGGVGPAIEALGAGLPAREVLHPITGVWSVEVGPTLDRVYVLTPYRDWDHRHELQANQGAWPPAFPVAALSAGSKLLLPTQASGLK